MPGGFLEAEALALELLYEVCPERPGAVWVEARGPFQGTGTGCWNLGTSWAQQGYSCVCLPVPWSSLTEVGSSGVLWNVQLHRLGYRVMALLLSPVEVVAADIHLGLEEILWICKDVKTHRPLVLGVVTFIPATSCFHISENFIFSLGSSRFFLRYPTQNVSNCGFMPMLWVLDAFHSLIIVFTCVFHMFISYTSPVEYPILEDRLLSCSQKYPSVWNRIYYLINAQ